MKYLLADGVTEVEILPEGDIGLVPYTKAERQNVKFDVAFLPIAKVAEEMVSSLSSIGRPDEVPDEVEVNFGAKIGASGGFFGIAKAQTDASVSIKLKWKKPA